MIDVKELRIAILMLNREISKIPLFQKAFD